MKTIYLLGVASHSRDQMHKEYANQGKHIIIGVKGRQEFSLESFIQKHPYFKVVRCPEVGNTNYGEERNNGHILQPAIVEYDMAYVAPSKEPLTFATQGQAAVAALHQAGLANAQVQYRAGINR